MSNGSCELVTLSRVYSSDRWSRFIARHGWKPVVLVSKRVSQIFTLLLYLNLDLRRRGRKYVGAASRVFSVDFFFFFFFFLLVSKMRIEWRKTSFKKTCSKKWIRWGWASTVPNNPYYTGYSDLSRHFSVRKFFDVCILNFSLPE